MSAFPVFVVMYVGPHSQPLYWWTGIYENENDAINIVTDSNSCTEQNGCYWYRKYYALRIVNDDKKVVLIHSGEEVSLGTFECRYEKIYTGAFDLLTCIRDERDRSGRHGRYLLLKSGN